MSQAATAYDEVAYPSHPFPQTHPDRLATLAALFGMQPAAPESCRYLELGCGDGFNLIPLAFVMPESRFAGIDLSSTAIARGQEFAAQLGLNNIELACADVMTWQPPAAPFDYIAAHGLFSWVPAPVRQRVLELCRDCLAENGVAYISYNTFPGAHIRNMLRDMMRFHVGGITTPARKIEQAKALIRFLLAGQLKENEFTALLKKESDWILERNNDSVLFHDDLADVNQAFYFREFAALAREFGLQYLAEADFYEMQDRIYPPEVAKTLQQLEPDIVLKEQYLDFLKCRRFRQTLLCRAHIPLQREIDPAVVRQYRIASAAQAKDGADLGPGVIVAFTGVRGASLRIDHPLTKAALVELSSRWPYSPTFAELSLSASRRLGVSAADPDDVDVLAQVILAGYSAGIVELHRMTPPWIESPGPRPAISRLARTQLSRGDRFVTTLRHHPLDVENPLDRELLARLDGTCNHEALLAAAAEVISRHQAQIEPATLVEGVLQRAAKSALLTA